MPLVLIAMSDWLLLTQNSPLNVYQGSLSVSARTLRGQTTCLCLKQWEAGDVIKES